MPFDEASTKRNILRRHLQGVLPLLALVASCQTQPYYTPSPSIQYHESAADAFEGSSLWKLGEEFKRKAYVAGDRVCLKLNLDFGCYRSMSLADLQTLGKPLTNDDRLDFSHARQTIEIEKELREQRERGKTQYRAPAPPANMTCYPDPTNGTMECVPAGPPGY